MGRRSRLPRDPVEAYIDDLTHDGRGVAHVADKAVFVHGALPGENVRFVYRARRKQFDEGAVVEVLQASPQRVEARCPHFAECAGCSLQHLDYSAQLEAKHNVLVQALQRIGGIEPERWRQPVASEPWHYRRKARLSVRDVPGKGRVLVGFRERNGRYVADMHECHVLRRELGFLLDDLSALMGELSIARWIPQIEYAAGDDAAILVIRHLEPLNDNDLRRLSDFQRSSGMTIGLQSGGPETVVDLQGEAPDDLSYTVDGGELRLTFGPLDFVQINAGINEAIIARVLEEARLTGAERVLDLFCGLGNLTLPMARRCAAIVGVEGEAGLVARAHRNAEANGLANAEFHTADLREDHGSAGWARPGYDVVVIDPPRSGAREALPMIAATRADRVIYVSCNPGTLARDLGALTTDHGYRLESAGIFDMFPHTAHVECLAVLSRAQ